MTDKRLDMDSGLPAGDSCIVVLLVSLLGWLVLFALILGMITLIGAIQ